MPRMSPVMPACSGAETRRMARSTMFKWSLAARFARRNRTGSASSVVTMTSSRALRVSVKDATSYGSVDRDFFEELELVERLAGAEHDCELRILRHHHRQAGLFA